VRRSEILCYGLAEEIEELHARDLARRSKIPKRWTDFYDAHAATELGSLIYNRLHPSGTDPSVNTARDNPRPDTSQNTSKGVE